MEKTQESCHICGKKFKKTTDLKDRKIQLKVNGGNYTVHFNCAVKTILDPMVEFICKK